MLTTSNDNEQLNNWLGFLKGVRNGTPVVVQFGALSTDNSVMGIIWEKPAHDQISLIVGSDGLPSVLGMIQRSKVKFAPTRDVRGRPGDFYFKNKGVFLRILSIDKQVLQKSVPSEGVIEQENFILGSDSQERSSAKQVATSEVMGIARPPDSAPAVAPAGILDNPAIPAQSRASAANVDSKIYDAKGRLDEHGLSFLLDRLDEGAGGGQPLNRGEMNLLSGMLHELQKRIDLHAMMHASSFLMGGQGVLYSKAPKQDQWKPVMRNVGMIGWHLIDKSIDPEQISDLEWIRAWRWYHKTAPAICELVVVKTPDGEMDYDWLEPGRRRSESSEHENIAFFAENKGETQFWMPYEDFQRLAPLWAKEKLGQLPVRIRQRVMHLKSEYDRLHSASGK